MKHSMQKIKRELIYLLANSKIGLSGTQISKKLNINRITMSKYLNIFVSEGLIKKSKIGNTNLWFIEEGIAHFYFPEDYFKIKNQYFDSIYSFSNMCSINLIRSSLYSDADPTKIILEIIVPSINYVQKLYSEGKISRLETKLCHRIILDSISLINNSATNIDLDKNIIIMSDGSNMLQAEAASASFRSNNWNVLFLGDISDTLDLLFDIDIQTFFNKVWTKKGIVLILIFVESEEKIKFFSETIKTIKKKFNNNIFLMMFNSHIKTNTGTNLVTNDLDAVFQWAETKVDRLLKWAE
ncbi:MAG: winged helix-turn-helix domain-containing protein [Thaumarchaeota archaeon]|nr:winged helix-turn-helix domain-containing protein [Nitrososphaerota archaeon]